MRIGVDLDNVLLEFQPFWADLYEEWFGLEVDREKLVTWDAIVDETHFPSGQHMLDWFGRAGGWERMPYVPGGPFGVDTLLELGHHITFVTARNGDAVMPTKRWFDASPWGGHQRVTLRVNAGLKSHVPASLYIDDSPHVIEHLLEAGKDVIVFDQPWNQGAGEIHRAKDWHEVVELVRIIGEGEAA